MWNSLFFSTRRLVILNSSLRYLTWELNSQVKSKLRLGNLREVEQHQESTSPKHKPEVSLEFERLQSLYCSLHTRVVMLTSQSHENKCVGTTLSGFQNLHPFKSRVLAGGLCSQHRWCSFVRQCWQYGACVASKAQCWQCGACVGSKAQCWQYGACVGSMAQCWQYGAVLAVWRVRQQCGDLNITRQRELSLQKVHIQTGERG